MSDGESDRERWMRIREERLAARDPRKKESKTQRKIAEHHRRSRQSFSFHSMLADIPHRLRGAFFGAILGGLIGALIPYFVEAGWADSMWMATVVMVAIIGYIYGQALDAKDAIQDALRRYDKKN